MATSPDNLTLYRYKRTSKGYTEDLGEGAFLTLMLIPAGEFMMGAPDDEPESSARERPQPAVLSMRTILAVEEASNASANAGDLNR